jgi:hypothetical protein
MRITVVDSPKQADEWVQRHIIDRSVKILGLDVEWKPVFAGCGFPRTSLLQIAAEDEVLLIRLFHLQPNGVPPLLTKVLGDGKVRKAGVGVQQDGAKLLTDWGVRVEGIVDISEQLQKLEGEENYLSLAKVTLRLIGVDMCKDRNVTMSNWELGVLSRDQILYAAIDAWVGRLYGGHLPTHTYCIHIARQRWNFLPPAFLRAARRIRQPARTEFVRVLLRVSFPPRCLLCAGAVSGQEIRT